MKKYKIIFIFSALFLFYGTNLVFAQQLITNSKAKDYVGDFGKKFSSGTYTVQVLSRNLPHPSTQTKIDGIVFNAQSGSFRYVRRMDGDHILILLSYKKTPVNKIDAANVAEFGKIVKENKLTPYILLNQEGAELAIVYAPPAARITSIQKKDKSVYLEVEVPAFRKIFFMQEIEKINNNK